MVELRSEGMEPSTFATVADRFQTTLNPRPWLLDTVLAIGVVVVAAISRPGLSVETPMEVLYVGIVIASAAALILRRTRPLASLGAIAVLMLVHLVAGIELGLCTALVCTIAAYTTQTQISRPWRWIALSTVYAGAGSAILTAPIAAPGIGVRERLAAVAAGLVWLTVAVLAGTVRRQRQIRYEAAIERASVLQAQQVAERRIAVLEERTRIAREMHDVVGHSLNAIAVQAEGVRYVLRADADRADRALADIGELSRAAVDEVRELLDVLADDEQNAPVRPTPTVRDVPELIGSLRYTSAGIRLRIEGDTEAVPDHIGTTAYRVVQEGLTNALKHAQGAPVTVYLAVRDHAMDVAILNTASTTHAEPKSGGGHGIAGMRERVRASGGVLLAGPDSATGGWRVSANLPWASA